jgi:predicted membrane protein
LEREIEDVFRVTHKHGITTVFPMLELAISLEMISIGPSKISPFVHFSDFRVLGIRGLGGA